MSKRSEIQDEARRWLGTPVRHQHQLLGHGVDCRGHIVAVGEACGVLTIDPKKWEPFAAYGEAPSPRLVLGFLRTFLKRREVHVGLPGDIACIAWRPGLPMHLAILGDFQGRPTLIHASGLRGQVVEHGFSAEWPGLVHSWWRYPGVAPTVTGTR